MFKIFLALATSDEFLAIFMPIVVYWIYSGMYMMLESFENYKLHSKKEEEKNLVSRKTVIKGVLFQQIFQAIVIFLLFKVTGGNDAMGILYLHHNKFLYRNFHSYHHRLVVPYAFEALYNHQVDGLLSDTVGGALAAFLSGMSPRISTFFCFATIKAVDDHSGMLLPGNPFHSFFWNNTTFHDVHHQLYGDKYNFETPFFVTWDKIMGTYMPYSIEKRTEGGFEARSIKECKDD
ncbi:hypothetical protein CRYUN_Cryun29cG0101000 [Craigia yunnanensis]